MKNDFMEPLRARSIEVQPTPARRHSKNGRVERRHRTLKDIMDRLFVHNQREGRLPGFASRVSKANFIGNMLYGSKYASSFELALGYTLSIEGIGQVLLPPEILEAQKEMTAKRALSRAQPRQIQRGRVES